MKKLTFLALAAAGYLAFEIQPTAQAAEPRADHYIVQVADGVAPAVVATRHGVAPRFVYSRAVNGFAGFVPPGRVAALQADPAVVALIPDRVVSAIAKPGGGGTTPPPGQILPEGVKRIGAAPGGTAETGFGVGVAIVDTGVDFNHVDLALGTSAFDAHPTAGRVTGQDDNGHGTHVGGIVAAKNNTNDVVGVAPNATLYAVKVLDSAGSGYDSDIIAGLDWIANNATFVQPPIRVANMSLGRAGSVDDNPAMRDAIKALVITNGITVVVAAGNDCALEASQQVPASYPEVIAVASTTAINGKANKRGQYVPADSASYFTTDGVGVAVSAPGEDKEDIGGALLNSIGILSTRLGGGTTRLSGTSMASPHVAGVAALLCEQANNTPLVIFTPDDARRKIQSGATRTGTAPLNSPTGCYSFDGVREGVLSAPGALGAP